MKVFTTILRVIGFVAGVGALVWGCFIAGFTGQPIPLIAAGVLLILMSWVGSNWEEIAAKFGDSEVRVKRAVTEKTADAVKAINEVAAIATQAEGVPPSAKQAVQDAARRARNNLLHDLKYKSGSLAPSMSVGAPDSEGHRLIRVGGTRNGDWSVDWRIVLTVGKKTYKLTVDDGDFVYPTDWGLETTPAKATAIFGNGSIYDGDERDGFEFILDMVDIEWPQATAVSSGN